MKTVFSNNWDVCHEFNLQQQNTGRAGNIFFERDTIYSYGRHYVLAQFINPKTVVINNIGYSVSTSKHISIIRSATSDKKQILTENAEPSRVLSQLKQLSGKFKTSYKCHRYFNQINALYNSFIHSCDVLGGYLYLDNWTSKYSIKPLSDCIQLNEIKEIYSFINNTENTERANKSLEKEITRQSRKQELDLKRKLVNIDKFRSYTVDHVFGLDFDLLRVSLCGNYVETTQRVKIPKSEAIRYFNLFKSKDLNNGEKIGQFTTLDVNEKYIKIGCHKIPVSEIIETGNKL